MKAGKRKVGAEMHRFIARQKEVTNFLHTINLFIQPVVAIQHYPNRKPYVHTLEAEFSLD
jgi:hypothetical protein